MKVLLRFKHGVGDCCQLGIVIKHLAHYRPEWEIGVECLPGCESLFSVPAHPLAMPFDWRGQYEKIITLDWLRPENWEASIPSTKPTRCLREVFQLEPIEELYRYEIPRAPSQLVEEFAAAGPYALIHYQGTSRKPLKDLSQQQALALCRLAESLGLRPVVLSFYWNQSPLEQFRAAVPKDGRTVCELIRGARLVLGIDSGPEHIAGATDTRTVVFWQGIHPLQAYDLAPNVLHVLPRQRIPAAAQRYFDEKYRSEYYDEKIDGRTLDRVTRLIEVQK